MFEEEPTGRRAALRRIGLLVAGVMLTGEQLIFDNLLVKESLAAKGSLKIYKRAEWNARDPKVDAAIVSHGPSLIVVHHTATPNVSNFGKKAAFRLSRRIQRHHMKTNDWDDIGQQFTISRGGHVMEGRNRTIPAVKRRQHVVGAHVAGHNRRSVGIENEGHYMRSQPPERQLDALVDLVSWLCRRYDLDPGEAIVGHRDLNATLCPGDRLYALLPTLRKKVAHRLRKDLRVSDEVAWPPGQDLWEVPAQPYDHGPVVGPGESAGFDGSGD